ncbi:MAG: phosphoribosylpyrophosphate synthetase [Bacteroidota bacterium]
MKTFSSLIDGINYYKSLGYVTDYNLAFDQLICTENLIRLHPQDFEIIEAIRFDKNTDPGEESILYVVQGKDGNHKGTIVSAFGTYADDISKELLDKLAFHQP